MNFQFLKRLFAPNYLQHPEFKNLVDEKSRQALMMMLVKFQGVYDEFYFFSYAGPVWCLFI